MSPDPNPGGGGEIAATPERLCRLGQELESQVGPHFDKAVGNVQEVRGIGHALFTQTAYSFAAMYVEAVEFMEEDLKTKRKDLGQIHERLCKSGNVWAMAEDKSTLKTT